MAGCHVMVKPIGPICNLDCAYCYYLHKDGLFPAREDFRMREEVLDRFIGEYISANPGPRVDFAWQGGEPTMMGLDFFRRVVAVQRRLAPPGVSCVNALQTNGTLLDEQWCRFFRENGFLIGISLDGPEECHDVYRVDKAGRTTYASVVRGLRLLQSQGVDHNVLCTVNRFNSVRPLEVYRHFRDLGVTWLQFIPIVERLEGGRVSERSVLPEDYGSFLTEIFDTWVRHDIGTVFVQLFEECASVWAGLPASLCVLRETCGRALAMEHNGDVYACDHFVTLEHRLGNLLQVPLSEIVEAPRQKAFGTAKRDRLPATCRSCTYRFICNGGCPKDRFVRSEHGEEGLNYLCDGYRRFFAHADPYLRRLAALWRRGEPPAGLMAMLRREERGARQAVGRNDRCPCGSGRKYKHCCLGRRASDGTS